MFGCLERWKENKILLLISQIYWNRFIKLATFWKFSKKSIGPLPIVTTWPAQPKISRPRWDASLLIRLWAGPIRNSHLSQAPSKIGLIQVGLRQFNPIYDNPFVAWNRLARLFHGLGNLAQAHSYIDYTNH